MRGVGDALRRAGGCKSLYIEASIVGTRSLSASLIDLALQHARHLELGGELRDLLAHDRVFAQRLAVARLLSHEVDQAASSLISMGPTGSIVKRSRSSASQMYVQALADLAHHVVVGHEDVVEEDLVGALVADGLGRMDLEARDDPWAPGRA